jgi:hypothetical protein
MYIIITEREVNKMMYRHGNTAITLNEVTEVRKERLNNGKYGVKVFYKNIPWNGFLNLPSEEVAETIFTEILEMMNKTIDK